MLIVLFCTKEHMRSQSYTTLQYHEATCTHRLQHTLWAWSTGDSTGSHTTGTYEILCGESLIKEPFSKNPTMMDDGDDDDDEVDNHLHTQMTVKNS